jgi:hypothetical protein
MSPYLVYLLSVRRWDLTDTLITINVVAVLLAVLAFRSTGFEQIGYRFSLDFLPLVFWLLMRTRVKISIEFKTLVFLATIADLCMVAFFLATGFDRRQS